MIEIIFNKIKGFVLSGMLILGLSACQSTSEIIPDNENESMDGDSITVALAPQSLEWVESPIARASNDDLYGVMVEQSDKPYGQANYNNTYYAFALFDDLNLITLKLVKNKYYHFKMVYVPNGKNIIEKIEDGWAEPFYLFWHNEQPKLNSVLYAHPINSEGFVNSYSRPKGCTEKQSVNEVLRYMGTYANYFAEENGQKVQIDLYKWLFGIRIIANDFTEGTICFKENTGWPNMTILKMEANSSGTSTMEYYLEFPSYVDPSNYSIITSYDPSMAPSYTELISLPNQSLGYIVYYTTPAGENIILWSTPISSTVFHRMKMYTLEFSLNEAITNGGISPNIVGGDSENMEELSWEL